MNSQDLQTELTTLNNELQTVTALASQVEAYRQRLTTATSGHVLGRVTAQDLATASADYDTAVDAVSRRAILQQAVAEAKRNLDYSISQERVAFNKSIGDQFIQVRERYVIESKKLLDLFKEMHRLHVQSISMRSHTLLVESDYRLDLPAIRRPADSELFSVGSMVRDGAIK